MAGFRDTLNLPSTEFPMKADLQQREPARLAWWKERDIEKKLAEARRGSPVWLLHDGPPYSNGHLHVGTAANKIWKDASVRQASMRGFDSPYVPGWDNHGMPIEIQVGREFREKKVQPDRVTLRRRCREFATEWVGVQREEFERLGVWGDWRHPYLTMSSDFEATILETFARLSERGYVQRGLRSIHWCPTDKTALAEAEIEYQDDASPSIHVAFPLRQDPRGALARFPGVSAVAWTTTPWTLPANLGLMVDPGATYVVLEDGDRRLLVAKERAAAFTEAAGIGGSSVKAELPGRELVGLVFEGPWGNESRVVDGTPFVSMEDGTGIVHTAPGHGKEDFQVGQKHGLGVLCPVDEAGRFTAGAEPFVGRSVLEVNDDIIAWLAERGRLLSKGTITHSYPHCWRCRQPVIFRATKQWFMIIDHAPEPLVSGARLTHRQRALDAIERDVRWDPASSRNRIRESVRGRPDWCLSRQRSWGVGIPAVYCESCGEALLDARVMARAAEWTRKSGSDAWFENPVEDFLPPGMKCEHCGSGGPFRKETDILDVWFDSGCTHRALRVSHPDLVSRFDRGLEAAAPGEGVAYLEGPDQHRGWFNSSLMVAVGCTDRPPYTEVYTHGWVLDAQGRAMHKSLGNVIAPMDIVKRSGAEIVRWWALATDWRSDVRIGDEILVRVAEAYRKVRNTFRFLLGNLSDFDPAVNSVAPQSLTEVDRAFHEFLERRVEQMRSAYTRLEFHRVLDLLLDVCTVHLSAAFLDVAKDRLYTLGRNDPARRSAQTVLWRALHDLCVLTGPALVFTAEEVWQHHPALLRERESVHLAVLEPAASPADDPARWERLLEVRAGVNGAIEPLRAAKTIATTQEAAVTLTVAESERWLEHFAHELRDFLMVAELEVVPGGPAADGAAFTAVARPAGERYRKCERCWNQRDDVSEAGVCGRCRSVLEAIEGAERR